MAFVAWEKWEPKPYRALHQRTKCDICGKEMVDGPTCEKCGKDLCGEHQWWLKLEHQMVSAPVRFLCPSCVIDVAQLIMAGQEVQRSKREDRQPPEDLVEWLKESPTHDAAYL